MTEWIGVDLDGTLAMYDGWKGIDHIGEPVPEMIRRVRGWLLEGKTVKIFTARAAQTDSIPFIEVWLEKHGLGGLEITNCKDMNMIELWDDRAIQVVPNTGMRVDEQHKNSFSLLKQLEDEIMFIERDLIGEEI